MGEMMGRLSISQMRRELVSFCANEAYPGGLMAHPERNPGEFFQFVRGELEFAAVAAAEWADAKGAFYQDVKLKDSAFAAMEGATSIFLEDGAVGRAGDSNSTYFALMPMTFALAIFKAAGVEAERIAKLVPQCTKLFDTALRLRPPVLEYPNPRGLEAVAALGLHKLTGRQDYLDLAVSRTKGVIELQYPCGAQPYHVAGWIWGRRPAQVYQLLSACMVMYVGRELGMKEPEAFARRMMDYELISTTSRGDAFTTPFEGLYKISQGSCAAWHWPIALALGDERFLPLANATYDYWFEHMDRTAPLRTWGRFHDPVLGLLCMHLVGVHELREAPKFRPTQGIHAVPDISTIFVHEPGVDVGMSVLSGYSSWVEADCGDVKLLAIGPELTDDPTYRNFGTDSLRMNWRVATELDKCRVGDDGEAVLRGRGFTKWDVADVKCKDVSQLHTRQLETSLKYKGRELVISYRTLADKSTLVVPSRILLLLGVFPWTASGKLTIGDETWTTPPAAQTTVGDFEICSAPGPVVLEGPDGSRMRIDVEIAGFERVVVERPPYVVRDTLVVKPAPDGFMRLAFEGTDMLKSGKITIRFEPRVTG
jgi:hypothetical protein